jgi:hypothetical protein
MQMPSTHTSRAISIDKLVVCNDVTNDQMSGTISSPATIQVRPHVSIRTSLTRVASAAIAWAKLDRADPSRD